MNTPAQLSHFFSKLRSNTELSLTPRHLADLHYLILVYKPDTSEQILSLCEKVLLQDPSYKNIFRQLFKEHVSSIHFSAPQKISKPPEPIENIQEEDIPKKPVTSSKTGESTKTESTPSKSTNPKGNEKKELREALDFVTDIAEQVSEVDHEVQSKTKRTYIIEEKFWPFTGRQFQKYWKAKQNSDRLVPSHEVDIPSTVNLIAENQGLFTELVFKKSKVSSVNKVLFLIDSDRSMIPFQGIQKYVVSNLIQSVKPTVYEKAYFKGIANLEKERLTSRSRAKNLGPNDWVVIISDGDAASGQYLSSNVNLAVALFKELQKYTNHVFWFNPLPKDKWLGSSAFYCSLYIDMIGLDKSEYINSLNDKYLEEKSKGEAGWSKIRFKDDRKNVRLEAFYKKSEGKPEYLHLALLSSFFPAFTFDLLGKVAQNFPYKSTYFQENIPSVASDLLGSSLVRHIGSGLYELYPDVKGRLFQYLEVRFGYDNLLELSRFLNAYTRRSNPNELNLGVSEAYEFLALCYLNPSKAARLYLDNLDNHNKSGYYNKIKPNLEKRHGNLFFLVTQIVEEKGLLGKRADKEDTPIDKDYAELLPQQVRVKLPEQVLNILRGRNGAEAPKSVDKEPKQSSKKKGILNIIHLHLTAQQQEALTNHYDYLLLQTRKRPPPKPATRRRPPAGHAGSPGRPAPNTQDTRSRPHPAPAPAAHPRRQYFAQPPLAAGGGRCAYSLPHQRATRPPAKRASPSKPAPPQSAGDDLRAGGHPRPPFLRGGRRPHHPSLRPAVRARAGAGGLHGGRLPAKPATQKLKENHYHILHFSGHGSFRDGQGWLELEDELRMEKQLTSAADFAAALNAKPEHCPALVLLSSCQTAQGQKEETFKGVSNRLLEIGVPAVVAMGLSISDYFATVFAGHLYQQLAEKEPLHRAFQSAIAIRSKKKPGCSPSNRPHSG